MAVSDSRTPALTDRAPETWLLAGTALCVALLELAYILSPAPVLSDARFVLGLVTLTVVPTFALVGAARGAVSLPASVLAVVAGPVYGYTAFVLPWDQFAFLIGQISLELLLAVPVVGNPLASVLFGGFSLSQRTLELFAGYHPAATAGLVVAGALTLVHLAFADRT